MDWCPVQEAGVRGGGGGEGVKYSHSFNTLETRDKHRPCEPLSLKKDLALLQINKAMIRVNK